MQRCFSSAQADSNWACVCRLLHSLTIPLQVVPTLDFLAWLLELLSRDLYCWFRISEQSRRCRNKIIYRCLAKVKMTPMHQFLRCDCHLCFFHLSPRKNVCTEHPHNFCFLQPSSIEMSFQYYPKSRKAESSTTTWAQFFVWKVSNTWSPQCINKVSSDAEFSVKISAAVTLKLQTNGLWLNKLSFDVNARRNYSYIEYTVFAMQKQILHWSRVFSQDFGRRHPEALKIAPSSLRYSAVIHAVSRKEDHDVVTVVLFLEGPNQYVLRCLTAKCGGSQVSP